MHTSLNKHAGETNTRTMDKHSHIICKCWNVDMPFLTIYDITCESKIPKSLRLLNIVLHCNYENFWWWTMDVTYMHAMNTLTWIILHAHNSKHTKINSRKRSYLRLDVHLFTRQVPLGIRLQKPQKCHRPRCRGKTPWETSRCCASIAFVGRQQRICLEAGHIVLVYSRTESCKQSLRILVAA